MNRVFFPLLSQEFGKRTRIRLGWQRSAMIGRDLANSIPPLWRLYHPADEWDPLPAQEFRHRHVGGDHKAFDHVPSAILPLHRKFLQLAVAHDRYGFAFAESERALRFAESPKPFCGLEL